MAFEAVLFDAGGVLSDSLLPDLVKSITGANLDFNTVLPVLMAAVADTADTDSLPHRCERGEASLADLLAWANEQVPGLGPLLDPGSPSFSFQATRPNQEMLSFVREVRSSGRRTGVLSNLFPGWDEFFEAQTQELGLDQFDAVLISCRVGSRKPSPASYRLACQALGAAPADVLYLDDTLAMVEGARAAGLTAVHVQNHSDAIREARLLLS